MALQDTLEELIRFRSVTGRKEEALELFAWVKNELKHLPVFFAEYESNGFPSMVVTTKPAAKHAKVLLMAHIDVVEGSPQVFQPHVEGGRLYGRGAFDMKDAAAMFVEYLKELGDEVSHYDLAMMLTSDEEIGGWNGTRYLIEEQGYRADVALLPESGVAPWHFEQAAKGMWRGVVRATGHTTHASRPWDGESATKKLNNYLAELNRLFEDLVTDDPKHWYSTLNIASMEANFEYGQVPDVAEAKLDIRFTTDEEWKRLFKEMQSRAKKYTIALEETLIAHAISIDEHQPDLESFADIAKEKYGIECSFTRSHGTHDGRFFGKYNTPVLVIWPEGAGHHGENEWINLEDLERYYNIMKVWVDERACVEEKSPLMLGEEKTAYKKKKATAMSK